MVQECKVYRGVESRVFSFDPGMTLAAARSQMRAEQFMNDSDVFTYYDDRQQKHLTQPVSTESRYPLKAALGVNNQVTIYDPNAGKPDLQGNLVQWFTDRNLQVAVRLHENNQDAQNANRGKFSPFLLTEVEPLKDAGNIDRNIFFKNAIICEKGSAISFSFSCWGAAGYCYSIESERVKIVPPDAMLYCVNDGNYGTTQFSGLDRFSKTAQNIVVDSLSDQSIPIGDKAQYSRVTMTCWNVTKYNSGGQTYQSNLRAPFLAGEPNGFQIQGGVIVPGDGIESASPHADGQSTSTFGSISGAQRDDQVLGRIEIYFLVFVNKAAATQMIQQNNLINPF
jgi:hypothetical protein